MTRASVKTCACTSSSITSSPDNKMEIYMYTIYEHVYIFTQYVGDFRPRIFTPSSEIQRRQSVDWKCHRGVTVWIQSINQPIQNLINQSISQSNDDESNVSATALGWSEALLRTSALHTLLDFKDSTHHHTPHMTLVRWPHVSDQASSPATPVCWIDFSTNRTEHGCGFDQRRG